MIKKILIPTDGYGLEEHVIRYSAKAFSLAEFYVISVVNTYETGVNMNDLLYKEMKTCARNAIERAEEILREEGINNIKSSVIEGVPSKKIIKYAKKHDVDLIAMRVYSRKDTASAQRIGSTLRNVLIKSPIPVLTLAKECKKLPIRKVLLPTDGTKVSERAKNYAIVFASSYKTELEVLHVSQSKRGIDILNNAEWKASFLKLEVKKSLEYGDVEEKILEYANKNDLIIMGLGKKILFWHIIGHIARAIITHSPVPVILVHSYKKR